MTITHTYTGTTDSDGDGSPFTGLHVELVEFFGMTQAGFDCRVRLDCTAEELAERYGRANPGWRYRASEMKAWHGGGHLGRDSSALYIECCLSDDLTIRDDLTGVYCECGTPLSGIDPVTGETVGAGCPSCADMSHDPRPPIEPHAASATRDSEHRR